ncbi:hypothetical protein SCLCIDRAFT_704258 [Scleroderma citrinum Foug A]|uniref:Uncharacterized protein n=1 Tax=Scleroderma citrinum Foug A TaxID=1036808 RepID=A0A0C3ENK9_9AGAM|nr:hypothetical protein SCLCIDRAFT_704258 [Scleroderma citrinum Foug A]
MEWSQHNQWVCKWRLSYLHRATAEDRVGGGNQPSTENDWINWEVLVVLFVMEVIWQLQSHGAQELAHFFARVKKNGLIVYARLAFVST